MNLQHLTQLNLEVAALMGVGCQLGCHRLTFSRKCQTFSGRHELEVRWNKKLICGVNLRCLFGSLSSGCKMIQLEPLYTHWSIHDPLRGRINRAISFFFAQWSEWVVSCLSEALLISLLSFWTRTQMKLDYLNSCAAILGPEVEGSMHIMCCTDKHW